MLEAFVEMESEGCAGTYLISRGEIMFTSFPPCCSDTLGPACQLMLL